MPWSLPEGTRLRESALLEILAGKHGEASSPLIFTLAPFQRGLSVAPVLANLGPLEHLTLKPNSQEVSQAGILQEILKLLIQLLTSATF